MHHIAQLAKCVSRALLRWYDAIMQDSFHSIQGMFRRGVSLAIDAPSGGSLARTIWLSEPSPMGQRQVNIRVKSEDALSLAGQIPRVPSSTRQSKERGIRLLAGLAALKTRQQLALAAET